MKTPKTTQNEGVLDLAAITSALLTEEYYSLSNSDTFLREVSLVRFVSGF